MGKIYLTGQSIDTVKHLRIFVLFWANYPTLRVNFLKIKGLITKNPLNYRVIFTFIPNYQFFAFSYFNFTAVNNLIPLTVTPLNIAVN